jgi:hypothetical protein
MDPNRPYDPNQPPAGYGHPQNAYGQQPQQGGYGTFQPVQPAAVQQGLYNTTNYAPQGQHPAQLQQPPQGYGNLQAGLAPPSPIMGVSQGAGGYSGYTPVPGLSMAAYTAALGGHIQRHAAQPDPQKLELALQSTPDDDAWGPARDFNLTPANVDAMLHDLKTGNWPVGMVIGARILRSFESLGKAFHESGNISQGDLAAACKKHISFSSVEGHSLRGKESGASKFVRSQFQGKIYFGMSRWGTIYAIEEKNVAARDARRDLRLWLDGVIEVDNQTYRRMPEPTPIPGVPNFQSRPYNRPLVEVVTWTDRYAANSGKWSFRLIPDMPPPAYGMPPNNGGWQR